MTPQLEEVRRILDTHTLDADVLAGLEREAGTHAEGYRTVTWVERAPEAYLPGLAELAGRMMLDAPTGDLAREPENWDVERWLAKEGNVLAMGRSASGRWHCAARRSSRTTDFGIVRAEPTVGFQWETIVRADHRGHRLGMLVKIANLRLLQERSPATRWVNTWNAASNAYMVSINEALGWRAVDTWTESQLDL